MSKRWRVNSPSANMNCESLGAGTRVGTSAMIFHGQERKKVTEGIMINLKIKFY